MSDEQVIREYLVRKINMWIHDEYPQNTISAMVARAIADDAANGNGCREEYERMLRTGDMREEYAACAGSEVIEYLTDEIIEGSGGWVHDLIMDIIDMNDSDMARMLGDSWLPTDPDNIEWSNDDDDDECGSNESLNGVDADYYD
ncbi:MAG TPA: hypothetical protein VIY48_14175 [Candidatus Paceibacterota bacterium]